MSKTDIAITFSKYK